MNKTLLAVAVALAYSVTAGMTEADIKAVADYVAGLH